MEVRVRVRSSVTLWTIWPNPVGALANLLNLVPETPSRQLRDEGSAYCFDLDCGILQGSWFVKFHLINVSVVAPRHD
jgi:hypothetical protein